MSQYNSLKATIDANVKQNGVQAITGNILNSVLNAMVNTLGAGYQFAGVATTTTNPGSPDAKVFYIANGKGTYTNFGGVEVTEDDVVVLYWDSSWHKVSTGIASQEKLSELEGAFQDLNGDTLYITDKDGYAIAKIDADGIHATEVEDFNDRFYPSQLHVTDSEGNVICTIDKDGIKTTSIIAKNLFTNPWSDKVIATYGDSVTALNGGDHVFPFVKSTYGWALDVANYFKFSALRNRGIGSTTFNWYNSAGGQICWVKTNTGEYVNRNDSYTYDNYQGHVTIPSDCTPIRGCGSSWLRITSMFKEEFKDTIDVVLVMYHNDFHQDLDTEAAWVDGNDTDPEWAASSYYANYGGDYNIESVRGGIASVVMKLQAWMPNALIVLMTPISGVYVNGNEGVKDLENVESAKMKKLAEVVKEVAFRMSIPCIDVYGTDGINSLNHSQFITDGIHPYNNAGCLKIARAICSGLISIIPNLR